MQTTPRSARTSAPTQFAASFENQVSGTIYNTKYMLAIGKKLTKWNSSQWKTRFERNQTFLKQCLKNTMRWDAAYWVFHTKKWSSCSFEMQTIPRSARTSEPTYFSATFGNQGSGTIYNTKYMLAIGKKLRMWYCFTIENPLRTKSHISHTASIKHNALKCSLLSIPHKEII